MIRLPAKRQKLRSGIERAAKREWPRHRKWLRTFQCVVNNCQGGHIEVSHIRTAANAGTGIKPHDAFAVPMCSECHAYYHRIGHKTFERIYILNLAALAAEFTRKSPDQAMRESLKLLEVSDEPHR